MARRRYRFHGLEVIPGLSGLVPSLKGSVKGTHVILGIAAFLAAHFGVKYAMNKWLVGKVPPLAIRFAPLISGLAAAVALPYVGKKVLKLNPALVSGLAMGALGAGVTAVAVQEAKVAFPMLADYNDVRLSGMILNDPNLSGLLLTDSATAMPYGYAPGYTQTDFAALGAAGSGNPDDADDLAF